MDILFFCPMWGMATIPLPEMLYKIKTAGYDGIEFSFTDYSHFCVVAESYLEEQSEMLEQVNERSFHIHARVGYPQGPQVTDAIIKITL